MDTRTGCQAPAGSSGTGHCCPLTVGVPRLEWLALSLCSVTWPDCHRGLGYVEAGLQGEAPGGREVWGALGSRAQVVGWVAGAVEGAAMVAARARRASEGARAPRPGLTLWRGRQNQDIVISFKRLSEPSLLTDLHLPHRHYYARLFSNQPRVRDPEGVSVNATKGNASFPHVCQAMFLGLEHSLAVRYGHGMYPQGLGSGLQRRKHYFVPETHWLHGGTKSKSHLSPRQSAWTSSGVYLHSLGI